MNDYRKAFSTRYGMEKQLPAVVLGKLYILALLDTLIAGPYKHSFREHSIENLTLYIIANNRWTSLKLYRIIPYVNDAKFCTSRMRGFSDIFF